MPESHLEYHVTMMRLSAMIRVSAVTAVTAAILSCSSTETPLTVDDSDTIPTHPLDTIPPGTVTDPSLAYSVPEDRALLRWSAPYDNDPTEPVARYEIRFSYTRGAPPPDFWRRSTPVPDPPAPTSPGSPQSYTFRRPRRGEDLHVGIRSYDKAQNRSEPSDVATVHIPGLRFAARCVDVMTGAPLEGLAVRIAAGNEFRLTTDAQGEFSQDELHPGVVNVEIVAGSGGARYHRLNQPFVLGGDSTHTFHMISYREPIAAELQGFSLLTLFKLMTLNNTYGTVLAKWHRIPVPCYIPPYVSADGVDYESEARAAAQRWMDRTGTPLFAFVSSPPDTGIIVVYRSRASMSPNIAVTDHTTGSDLHPIRDEIRVVNDITSGAFLFRVMLHEFGHTIRLGHLSYPGFIMYIGQPLPDDITDDEVAVVRLHAAMPVRVDLRIYDDAVP